MAKALMLRGAYESSPDPFAELAAKREAELRRTLRQARFGTALLLALAVTILVGIAQLLGLW
jgi:hypothetical protein